MSDYRRTILLVEDDAAIRSLLTAILDDEGYFVIACPTGASAIDVLDRTPVALVISDVQMETADAGIRLLQHLRQQQQTQRTPVLLYSANTFVARDHGATLVTCRAEFITKPFDLDHLLRHIELLLGAGEPRYIERERGGMAAQPLAEG